MKRPNSLSPRISMSPRFALAFALAAGAAACQLEDSTGTIEPALEAGNGIMLNNGLKFHGGPRLLNDEALDHGLAVGHGLSVDHGLATEAGLSSTTGFLTTEAGQELVRYLVECALPLGHSISKGDPVHGGTISFDGYVGLAPAWETGPCDQDCQEWVSACLLARTNALGQPVQIEMVADHPAIGSERTNPSVYTTEEAGFYGNLFLDPPEMHACVGTLLDSLLSALELRVCGVVPWLTCGFDDAIGLCPGALGLLAECAGRVDDAYVDCRSDGGVPMRAITTYTNGLL